MAFEREIFSLREKQCGFQLGHVPDFQPPYSSERPTARCRRAGGGLLQVATNLRFKAQPLPELSDGDILSMIFFMRLVVVAMVTRPRLSGYRQRLAVLVNVVNDD
jgi:hypothetical protein